MLYNFDDTVPDKIIRYYSITVQRPAGWQVVMFPDQDISVVSLYSFIPLRKTIYIY